jgi:hypothetical protein
MEKEECDNQLFLLVRLAEDRGHDAEPLSFESINRDSSFKPSAKLYK